LYGLMGETPALELLPCRKSNKPFSNCANPSHVVNFEWHIHEHGGAGSSLATRLSAHIGPAQEPPRPTACR
jgi:hypothetical protein